MFRNVAEKLNFEINFTTKVRPSCFDYTNLTWHGVDKMVLDGLLDLRIISGTMGTHPYALDSFDFSAYLGYDMAFLFGSRKPIPLMTFNNILTTFNPNVWIAFFSSLAIFAISFAFVYHVYESSEAFKKHKLNGYLSTKWDFFLKTFFAFYEPDPIPWFPKLTSGRFLLWLWILFCNFMVFFYQCNLRASLIAVSYEKPINTIEDVLERNKPMWVPTQLDVFM